MKRQDILRETVFKAWHPSDVAAAFLRARSGTKSSGLLMTDGGVVKRLLMSLHGALAAAHLDVQLPLRAIEVAPRLLVPVGRRKMGESRTSGLASHPRNVAVTVCGVR